MLPLLLTLMVGQVQPDPIPRPRQYRSEGPARTSRLGQSDLAFFEAFPIGGAGTTVACSTTAPTGANSEALTFTRSSTAMCTKTAAGGLATTGIANGDLVSLGANVARVEYDSAGTLGLLAETARTNDALRSQEIDNAAWTKGPAIGTITADFATAPDGTTTAERYQYTNTNNDYILQAHSVGTLAAADSFYFRGTSGSGTINLCRGGASGQCITCSYVSTSWSRCIYAATLAISTNVFIGCETSTLGSACAQTGMDVLVWQGQFELGAFPTSPIPTTSAAVTRAAETASFPGAAFPVSPVSFATSVTVPWSGTTTAADTLYGNAGSASGLALGWTGATLRAQMCSGTCNTLDIVQGPTAGVTSRWAFAYSSGSASIFKDASLIAGPTAHTAAASPWSTNTTFASGTGWGALNGIISRICIDPNPTKCR